MHNLNDLNVVELKQLFKDIKTQMLSIGIEVKVTTHAFMPECRNCEHFCTKDMGACMNCITMICYDDEYRIRMFGDYLNDLARTEEWQNARRVLHHLRDEYYDGDIMNINKRKIFGQWKYV